MMYVEKERELLGHLTVAMTKAISSQAGHSPEGSEIRSEDRTAEVVLSAAGSALQPLCTVDDMIRSWWKHQAAKNGGCDVTSHIEQSCFTGAIGMIDNVVIHQDTYCPWGDTSQNQIFDPITGSLVAAPTSLGAPAAGTTSVGRAIFVGAQAAAYACGAISGPNGQPLKVQWVEELLDQDSGPSHCVSMSSKRRELREHLTAH